MSLKRILAILGILLILGLNIFLVFAAGSSNEDSSNIFNGAIIAVVLVPVLLWIYLYIYKLIKKRDNDKELEQELEEDN